MISIYKNNIQDIKTECNAFKRKKCYNKPVWAIFTGDGKPYLSRLRAFSCATHLSRICKSIIEEHSKDIICSIIDDDEHFSKEDFEL